ncbi:hypothetical protein TCAL_04156 [Tigriopus californicus]|uniref:3-hydroxyisobutyrate dehydrogenase n=1 Tax=Tigriopus californicus TaxID=6832 RepID=A0A553NU77_TIGCA|nr:3-hydroxyisobutyrate dehydrogenase, mitochondrial-like [Tigriopus californicus]TRY68987.1 hypothetical protein TCAL_04156 [Tigriopus californicus]
MWASKLGRLRRCFHPDSIRTLTSTPAVQANVGFIGLGNMGQGMAINLIEKGHEVLVYDVDPSAVEAMIARGAQKQGLPRDVAAHADHIVTMLPNNDIVREVYTGHDGLLGQIQPQTVLIDSSTIDPAVSQEIAAAAKAKQAIFVDAPVSGGVNAAAAGTLTFMVGAESAGDYEKAKVILDAMGQNITHCGEVGTGQAVKICNNMLLAISMIGVSETMNLGMNLGLDPKLLAKILGSATGRCWSVDTYNPVPGVMENVPSSNHYQGGFGTALMTKDLGLSQDAATRTKSATPLGSLAHQLYRVMCNSGYSGKDFSSSYEFLKKKD